MYLKSKVSYQPVNLIGVESSSHDDIAQTKKIFKSKGLCNNTDTDDIRECKLAKFSVNLWLSNSAMHKLSVQDGK